MPDKPVAIIDLGSNSVRLVVYAGSTRIPAIIFNEKLMVALGRSVAKTGAISATAQDRALAALERFHILVRQMGVVSVRVVATAAVREASNGAEFLSRVRAIGFKPEILSGEQEGEMAGQGVLSGIPAADGIVGDLGGGSLELVDVADGEVLSSVSLPLGVLRLNALIAKGEDRLARTVAKALDGLGLRKRGRDRPFYLVGGSWRALARLDMLATDHPLPIVHEYCMATDRPAALEKTLGDLVEGDAQSIAVSAARAPQLPQANALLKTIVAELQPSALIVSSFGIREGLLHAALPEKVRTLDPLIEAARDIGRGMGRFPEHGDLLDRWIAPVFDDKPRKARLRRAACFLADIAWQAHPDFRAERGVDMALHGNWVGVDGPGRVMIAQALFCAFGGGGKFTDIAAARLCKADDLARACQWGLAIRLAQRLSGGVAAGLLNSGLAVEEGVLELRLPANEQALYGEAVKRRHKALAGALGLAV